MIPPDKHLQIGSLAFDELDQMDLTGRFEVFAGLPNSTHRIFAKTASPVRDVQFMLAPWPWTLLVIRPTNDALLATDPIKADGKTRALIVKWGRLHLVRTALGALGTIALLYALAAD